jgi:glucokinase
MLLAVDTGGTKTLVTAFAHDGTPGEKYRFETPKDPADYLAALIELIHEHFDPKKLDAVVIASPGIVRDNVVQWGGTNLPWTKFNIVSGLRSFLVCPVWLENDANLAGLAETRALEEIPAQSLYVTISTGIGSGIIINGQIVPELSASEAGHALVEYDGRVRTWESFASGQAIKKTYNSYARDIHDKKVWAQIADKISRGFLTLIPTLQPDVIIIGGSIGTYFNRYDDELRRQLREHLPDHINLPKIRQAAHPEEAVLYGCYYYGRDKLAAR